MPAKTQLVSENSGLIAECTNLIGRLSLDTRKRLRDVINNPCQKTWNRAYYVIISAYKFSTLWQAIIAVNPDLQRCKASRIWEEIPDQLTMCRAIKMATSQSATTDETRRTA